MTEANDDPRYKRDMEMLEMICEKYQLKTTPKEYIPLWPSTVERIKHHLSMLQTMLSQTEYPFQEWGNRLSDDVKSTMDTIHYVIQQGK